MRSSVYILLLFFLMGCQRDSCEVFCEQLRKDIQYCINNGSLEWVDFDADSATDFSQTCIDEWTLMRTRIEPRVLEDIEQQCEEGTESLERECDLLKALHMEKW